MVIQYHANIFPRMQRVRWRNAIVPQLAIFVAEGLVYTMGRVSLFFKIVRTIPQTIEPNRPDGLTTYPLQNHCLAH